jgi:hypothetical protein
VLSNNAGGPLAELHRETGVNPVANGVDGVEVAKLNLPLNLSMAL